MLSVLSAILALATGYLAYNTAQINNQKALAESTVAQSDGELTQLQQKYKELQSQNAQLQAQVAGSGTTSGPVPPTTPGTVRHQGSITFVPGPGIDLDAPSSDTKWGQGRTGAEVFYGNNGGLNLSNSIVPFGKQPVDYTTCSTSTVYVVKDVDRGDVLPGNNFCVETSEHRYSGVTIEKVGNGQITLDIATWEPAETS